jgi:ABC-type sugar transport system substrate-binding protein
MVLAGLALAACSPQATATPTSGGGDGVTGAVSTNTVGPVAPTNKTAVILVPIYQEYFKIIADAVAAPLKDLGWSVEILGADMDPQTMIKQIQNYTVKKVGLMYIFPAGDASAFHDAVQEAHDAGIKVVISHNSTGPGTADSIIQADEFVEGTMDAVMADKWIDATYPDAAPGSVKVLILESSLVPDMLKRCGGMKLLAEKFLRKIDMTTARPIKTESPNTIYYMENEQKVEVTEPTGGLVLDDQGNAILNPFYNEKVKFIEFSNRVIMNNIDAQKSLDVAFAADNGANKDIKVVMSYSGDAAIGASEKFIALKTSGVVTADMSKIGVFGADDTQTNIDYLLQAKDPAKSVLRGVMTAGDIIGTIVKTVIALAKGETVEADQWEPLGYMTANSDFTDVVRVFYTNNLPATAKFFE